MGAPALNTANKALDVANKAVDHLPAVNDQVQAIANQIFIRLDAISQSVVDTANKYGPDVINVGLQVTRIDCLSIITGFFMYLILCAISIIIILKLVKKIDWSNGGGSGMDMTVFTIVLVSGAVAIVSLVISLFNVPTLWTIIGVIQPKIYIAHLVVEKALAVVK